MRQDYESDIMGIVKRWTPAILAGILAVIFLFTFTSLVEWNSDEDWQVCQFVNGSYKTVDTAGFYGQYYGEVWTYPKFLDLYFSAAKDEGIKEDMSIRVTFSDAGVGFTSHHIKLQIMPPEESKRILFHRHFAATGVKGIEHAIQQHLATALKNSGPMMTSSQHQAQRSAEFYQTVRAQLEEGLYGMRVVEQEVIQRQVGKSGDKVHQFSGSDRELQVLTEIATGPDKKSRIIATSPLKEYGFKVIQYSITGTKYDTQTQAQLSARSASYQLAEQAKAKVEAENSKTRLVIASGKSSVAKVQAEANKAMKTATVKAEQDVGVAEQKQAEEVSLQEQELATATQKVLETTQQLKISQIKVEQAAFEAAKTLADAEATRVQLEKGGAVAEVDKFVADMRRKQSVALATAVAKIPSPNTVIIVPNNGGKAGNSGSTTETMMQLLMLRQLGNPPESVTKK
jgi:hypothetical protein